MKNTAQCPKCGGKKIIVVPGRSYTHGFSPNIPTGWFSSAQVNHHICAACGFAELWAPYDEDVKKLEKEYGSTEPVD